MNSLRTSSLFHYPQKLDNLKKILAQGFKPNYCKEIFVILDRQDLIVGIPMVSFCDIPLTRITNFKNRYNEYAIGLSKEWGLKNGINPVLYATDNSHISSSLQIINLKREQINEQITEQSMHSGTQREINGETVQVKECSLKDPELRNELQLFVDNNNLFHVRSTLFGFTKTYYGIFKEKRQSNYEENEWRYVLRESISPKISWLWGSNSYTNWRGKGNLKPKSIFEHLVFDVDDVNFIILRDDTQIPKMIKYIEGLNEFGGGKSIDASQKYNLISKIISMDRIKKDF